METIWQPLNIQNIELYDSVFLLLGTYPRDMKTYVHIQTPHSHMNSHRSIIHDSQKW
jgi:hypothetical protein